MYVCLFTVLTTADNMQVCCGVRLSGSAFMYPSVRLSVHCSEVFCCVRLSECMIMYLFVDSV